MIFIDTNIFKHIKNNQNSKLFNLILSLFSDLLFATEFITFLTLVDFPIPSFGSPLFKPSNIIQALQISWLDTNPQREQFLRSGSLIFSFISNVSPTKEHIYHILYNYEITYNSYNRIIIFFTRMNNIEYRRRSNFL